MKKHIEYIDLIRTIACVFVVIIHCSPWIYTTPRGVDAGFAMIISAIIRIAVPLFFMISGGLLIPVKLSTLAFYKKRIPRILYPLLIWGAVYALFPIILGKTDIQTAIYDLILSPIKTAPDAGILWYLFILIGIYLILPFVSKALDSQSNTRIFIAIWICVALFDIVRVYLDGTLGENSYNLSDISMTTYFSGYLGYVILGYAIQSKAILLTQSKIWFLGTLGLLSAFLGFIIPTLSEYGKDILSIGTILFAGAFFAFFQKVSIKGIVKKIVDIIAPLSFGIYLTHILLVSIIAPIFYSISYSIPIQVALWVSSFLGSLLLTYLISKLPFSKYIIGI